MRRQHSAPARLLLGKLSYCLDRVSFLADRVDTLTSQTRSRSVSDLVLTGSDLSTSTMGDENPGKQRTCHSCHCPLNDPYHVGVQPGLEHCSLDHWEGCPGGVSSRGANGKEWKECPAVRASEVLGTEAEEDLKNEQKLDDKIKKPDEILSSEDSSSDSDDEELRIRQEEVEKLKRELAKSSKDQKRAEKKEKKRIMMENLELEKIELEKKTKAIKPPKSKPETQASCPQASNVLKDRAAAHAAKQQQKAESRSQQVDVEGLTMQQIRSLPGMSEQVESILANLQRGIPSLSKVATAARGSGPGFQPPGVLGELEQSRSHVLAGSDGTGQIDGDYVFVAELGKLVRIVPSVPQETSSTQGSDDDTSEDEDCPIEPEAGHHYVW